MADEEFTAFVHGAQKRLVRYADLLCGDRGRAEDLVQHALIKTYLAWRRVRSGNPEAYTRTVINHACIDWWRRRPWRETLAGGLTDDDAVPVGSAAHRDVADDVARRDLVMRSLALLTPRERAMIVLRHVYGLTESEVALELGCAVGTVKSGTSRARAKLRTQSHLRLEAVQLGV
jgi:RNA polymerase sigma-70 factor (sigma-E family)